MAREEKGKRWDSRELRLKAESCSQRWEAEDAGWEKSSENAQASKGKDHRHPALDLKHSLLSTDGESRLSGPTRSCHIWLTVPVAEASLRARTLDGAPCSWSCCSHSLHPRNAKVAQEPAPEKLLATHDFYTYETKESPAGWLGTLSDLGVTWEAPDLTQESGKEIGTTELKEPKAMAHTNTVDQSCIVFCNCTFKTENKLALCMNSNHG